MNFLIISEVEHKINDQHQTGAFAPYVKEMNLWAKYVDHITIIAPYCKETLTSIELIYDHPSITLKDVSFLNFTSPARILRSIVSLPRTIFIMFREMKKADHIHLRCPASIGLVASLVQLFFPRKKKTVKYAGNWDWNSRQPFSYRLQQYILRNTFFSRNMKVLVYGEWPDKTKNIFPFFTASYSEKEKEPVEPRSIDSAKKMKLIFVGAFTKNKQPLIPVRVTKALIDAGFSVELNMFGEGDEMPGVRHYIGANQLEPYVKLHGSQSSSVVKQYFMQSHFLVFVSQSEGWPKVVAEAMFWGCVPITTRVSCVAEMVDNGTRGALVNADVGEIVNTISNFVSNTAEYNQASLRGMEWSRQFTLERLKKEISKLI